MRSLIHIGQHKTGTTSIQHYLKSNRKALLERGLYIADSIAGYDAPSHFILNIYALKPERLSSMKERFIENAGIEALCEIYEHLPAEIERHYEAAKTASCKDIIWSNEGLYLLNSAEEYQKLKNLFLPHSDEMVCLCCFRDLDSYKTSYRKQHEKSGIAPSDDPDSYKYLGNDSWLFDYSRKRELLSSTFDNLIYFKYSKNNMVERFMKYVGYPIDTPEHEIPRLNVTGTNINNP
ncbi:hypothetical protein [Ectopseudomonas guguanensis]|uniref:Sulfotransferase family protein n=1 Tax=Ectopseudomonas guguanensis TaxID=1198456 RepID=A0A1H0TMD6_9GAMM|nr:hypothetical protein [Pseudomonas guguanensis]SDP55232.1 hypothetical protein SAMN05216213_104216 [Pseudomonas guguanensis]